MARPRSDTAESSRPLMKRSSRLPRMAQEWDATPLHSWLVASSSFESALLIQILSVVTNYKVLELLKL